MENNQFKYTQADYSFVGTSLSIDAGLNSIYKKNIKKDKLITQDITQDITANTLQTLYNVTTMDMYKKYIGAIKGTIEYDLCIASSYIKIFINDEEHDIYFDEHVNSMTFELYFCINPSASGNITIESPIDISISCNISLEPN